jgi:hypothetical protein
MTNDEQRINYLVLGPTGADDALAPADQAELDELNALLADPSLWDEPSADLGDRVVAAIGADLAATSPVPTPEPSVHPRNTSVPSEPSDNVVSIGRQSSRTGRRWMQPFLAGAAVAAAVALGVVALNRRTDDGSATVLALAGTELAPAGVSGTARITETESGLRIELDATGLPRREGRQFYQAWLKGEAGLVPIGTFHTGDNVVLWAGVSLADFPTLTVTLEEVGEQESSGQKVLVGNVADG